MEEKIKEELEVMFGFVFNEEEGYLDIAKLRELFLNFVIRNRKEAQKETVKHIQSLLVDYGTLEKHSNKNVEQVTKEIYKKLERYK